jgi:hypothetical protein
MNPKLVFIALGALLLTYCAGTQQGVNIDEKETGDDQASVQWDEEFDPLSLKDYKLETDARNIESDDVVTVEQLLRGNSVEDTVFAGQEVQGFRVQLISTRDQEEARSVLRNAVISFSEGVYRDYSNPYYKIRVGDFKSRYNASKLQEKAIEMGFHEAWVVRAMIWDGPPKSTQDLKENEGL